MANAKSRSFLQQIAKLKNFDFGLEVSELAQKHGETLDLVNALIDAQILPKDDACRFWANSIGVAYVDPFVSVITDEAIERLPAEVARKAKAIGLYAFDGVLTVAMADPTDAALVKRLAQVTTVPISPVFALAREIDDAITIHYATEKNLEEGLGVLERSSLFKDLDLAADKLAALAENEGLIRILDEIIHYAMRERATDIHFEAQERQSRIRFRVDGNLRHVLNYPRKLHRALITRIKVVSDLNISESRFPQDGRFSMTIGTRNANFRVSIISTAFGEKAVIRILALTGKRDIMTLERMMISQTILEPFRRLIRNPSGIIFVTGPTGSGKTTTLYAALEEINSPAINISTIEDPIEVQVENVNQSQINAHIDLKFSTILRALMRQDPDAILIGEIRDLETAKIATEAALTGHIVFATLHTNTAPQAITRLLEIGVEAYTVAPSIIGVLAQRLAARICENCKEAYQPSRKVLEQYFEDGGLHDITFYRGKGCPHCRGTGYKGRIAFHELLLVTEEIRSMITEGKGSQEITRAAAAIGYRPLRYDGLKKVLLGLTTIDEIEQSTTVEWSS